MFARAQTDIGLKQRCAQIFFCDHSLFFEQRTVFHNNINVFTRWVMDAFKATAEIITKQPGFISMQLHRAIGDNPTDLNYVVWESTEAVRAAFTDPEFAKLPAYPSSVVASPHLFEKAGAVMHHSSIRFHPISKTRLSNLPADRERTRANQILQRDDSKMGEDSSQKFERVIIRGWQGTSE